jgi:hypothetical protein
MEKRPGSQGFIVLRLCRKEPMAVSIPFRELRQLRQLGLSMSSLLVKAYLDEAGFQPIGKIADACGVSVSSVERSLAQLKKLGLLPAKMKHDMIIKHTEDKEPSSEVRATSGIDEGADTVKDDDPIRQQLMDYEVLPWLVDQLLVKVDRQELTRQLEYHGHRLAHGFRFRSHPARFLFTACLKRFDPPEGYHAHRHKAREGIQEPPKASEPIQPMQAAPEATQSPEEVIREMLRSPIVSVRRMAVKLAVSWGVSIPELQGVAL